MSPQPTALAYVLLLCSLLTTSAQSAGSLLWRYPDCDCGFNSVGSALVTPDNKVLFLDGSSLVLRNPDGSSNWTFSVGNTIGTSPSLSQGVVYCTAGDRVIAVDFRGTQKWSTATGATIRSSPCIGDDGTIYVGSGSKLIALANEGGGIKWSFNTGALIYSTPALGHNGEVYFTSTDGKLYAVSQSGSKLWEKTIVPNTWNTYLESSPAVDTNGVIYVTNPTNSLHAINRDGSTKWDFIPSYEPTGAYSSPAIGEDGTIFYGTFGFLYAVQPNGMEKWKYFPFSAPSSPSVGSDGTIYIGTGNNNVAAVSATGTNLWVFETLGTMAATIAISSDEHLYFGTVPYYSWADKKLFAVQGQPGDGPAPWPTFHRDNRRTGRVPRLPTLSELQDEVAPKGSHVRFIANVSGTPNFHYQWSFNGSVLPGATNSALDLLNVDTAAAGAYTVTVTNEAGSVTSGAQLTVVLPPSVSIAPSQQEVIQGSAASFVATTSGNLLSYQWHKDGIPLSDAPPFSGTTTESLTIRAVMNRDAGTYAVTVSNLAGVASAEAHLVVHVPPAAVVSPPQQSVLKGATATFMSSVSGSGPLSYQWKFNGTNLVGQTNDQLSIANAVEADAGEYSLLVTNVAGHAESESARLIVNVPAQISAQPISRTVRQGDDATLSVAASGTAPFTYQWFRDSSALPGATRETLMIEDLQETATFHVMVANVFGTTTSDPAKITVVVPPRITLQPISQITVAGTNVPFSVEASGSTPIHYQWFFNDSSIPGANSNRLTLADIGSDDGGIYSVCVSNSAGTAISSNALLSVLIPPNIVGEPTGHTVSLGSSLLYAGFAVSGTPPLSHTWFHNGLPLSEQTNGGLSLGPVTMGNGGEYYLVVTNMAGAFTSSVLTVTISLAPFTGVDLDWDGDTEILWQNTSGAVQAWLMQQTNYVSTRNLRKAPNPWRLILQPDLNSDGKQDFLWRHTDGGLMIWYLDGTNRLGTASLRKPNVGWVPVGSGDFNDDQKNDLVFQKSNGQAALWFLDGTNITSVTLAGGKVAATGSRLRLVTDMDLDGNPDLVWQRPTGIFNIWFLHGTALKETGTMKSIATSWRLAGTGDWDKDGKNDLLFQNADGRALVRLMNGTNYLSQMTLRNGFKMPKGWAVVGPK